MTGQVMLLNGAPSAGKTTLAKAMQDAAPTPLYHRSLDDFLAGYPLRFRASDDGTLFERLMIGYVHALAELAAAGNDVVAEAVIIPGRLSLYRAAFRDVPVLLVGVRCTLAVAQERERARTDRVHPIDLDVPWFGTVHELPYDLEVDTSDGSTAEETALTLLALFADPPAQRAFDTLPQ
jgi:chloramphenicol 3-O phosphotransferase